MGHQLRVFPDRPISARCGPYRRQIEDCGTSRTADFREDPLIMNEAAEPLRIADMRILPSPVSIAGHPSGTRPIRQVAEAIEIQRLRLKFGVPQLANHVYAIASTWTGQGR